MNKSELCAAISGSTGVSQSDVDKVLKGLEETVTSAVCAGGDKIVLTVLLHSNEDTVQHDPEETHKQERQSRLQQRIQLKFQQVPSSKQRQKPQPDLWCLMVRGRPRRPQQF